MLLLLVACADPSGRTFSPGDPRAFTITLAPEDAGSGDAPPSFTPVDLAAAAAGRTPDVVVDPVTGEADLPGRGRTVIIGAGLAGLAAAMEIPGPVTVFEADAVPGGRARYAGAFMFFVDTPELDDGGFPASAADVLSAFERLTGSPPTTATAAYFAESGAVRDRLYDDFGVRFELGHEDPVLHRFMQHHPTEDGIGIVNAFVAGLPDNVEIRYSTPVEDVLFAGGRVAGVRTAEEDVAADRVVIASGGFVNRPDLVNRFAAIPGSVWSVGTDGGARGAAVGWAERHGLQLTAMDAVGWNVNVLGVADSAGAPIPVLRPGNPPWIWVDRDGQRFVDESAGWSLTLAAQAASHDGVRAIVGWDTLLGEVDPAYVADLRAARDADVDLVCRPDAFQLARTIGVLPTALQATLDDVEAVRTGAATDALGRLGSTFLPVDGDVCALPLGRLASKNYGGLATDEEGRVLDRGGVVVPGLFAAGEAAGMGTPGLGGAFGFDGSIGAVVWSGWRTGDTVAADVLRVTYGLER